MRYIVLYVCQPEGKLELFMTIFRLVYNEINLPRGNCIAYLGNNLIVLYVVCSTTNYKTELIIKRNIKERLNSCMAITSYNSQY